MFYQTAKKILAGNALYESARRFRQKQRAARIERLNGKSYQERAAVNASEFQSIKGARVLVVGAGNGNDCRYFVANGASEVHGLDVVKDVGKDFKHRRAFFHCAGVEESGLPENYFDLVFSVATMEHVENIQAGFTEMVRVARPGGTIFSHAAPLWQSPYGHHLGCLEGHPWVHLIYDSPEALKVYAEQNGLSGQGDIKIEWLIDYIFAPQFFNRRPGHEYLEAIDDLKGIDIRQNVLVSEPQAMLEHPLGGMALARGYTAQSLLGTQHNFVAKKYSS